MAGHAMTALLRRTPLLSGSIAFHCARWLTTQSVKGPAWLSADATASLTNPASSSVRPSARPKSVDGAGACSWNSRR